MPHQQIDPHALGQQYNLGNFKKEYGRLFFLSPWWQFLPVAAFLLILIVPTVQGWVQGLANHAVPPLGPSLLIGGVFLLLVLLVIYALVTPARGIIKEFRAGEPVASFSPQAKARYRWSPVGRTSMSGMLLREIAMMVMNDNIDNRCC